MSICSSSSGGRRGRGANRVGSRGRRGGQGRRRLEEESGRFDLRGTQVETDLLHLELIGAPHDLVDSRADRGFGRFLDQGGQGLLYVRPARLNPLDLLEHGNGAGRRALGAEVLGQLQQNGNRVFAAAGLDQNVGQLHAGARVPRRVLDLGLELNHGLVPLLGGDQLRDALPPG
jgi:hypothetical protein